MLWNVLSRYEQYTWNSTSSSSTRPLPTVTSLPSLQLYFCRLRVFTLYLESLSYRIFNPSHSSSLMFQWNIPSSQHSVLAPCITHYENPITSFFFYIFSNLVNFIYFICCVYRCFACMYICILCAWLLPKEAWGGYQNSSHSELWSAMWVQWIKPGGAFNHRAISLASFIPFLSIYFQSKPCQLIEIELFFPIFSLHKPQTWPIEGLNAWQN